MKNVTAISFAMLVVLAILTACGPANPPATQSAAPMTEVLPTAVPTPAPSLTLPELAGLVCQGRGFSQAAAYDDESGAAHKIFIVNSNGEPHAWNDSLPPALQAQNVAELDGVLCLEAQVPLEEYFSCGDYTTSLNQPVELKVGQYHLAAKLIAAQTGEVIDQVEATGGRPVCPEKVSSDDPRWIGGAYYGDPVNFGNLLAEAAPMLVPGMISEVIEAKAGYVYTVAISDDRSRLATFNGPYKYDNKTPPGIYVWDAVTDQQLASLDGHEATVTALAFSPDNRFLASSDYTGRLLLWDLVKGGYRVLADGDSAARDSVQLAFTPDGETLASSGSSAPLHFWNVDSGKLMNKLATSGGGGRLILSRDGTRLIVFNRVTLELWNLQTQQLIGEIFDADRSLRWAGFSPDQKRVQALGFEINRYKTYEIDAETGKLLEAKDWVEFGQEMTEPLDPLVIPGLQWLVLTNKGRAWIIWDMQTNRELTWLHKGPEARFADESALGISANGQFFAIGDAEGYVNLWDFSWAFPSASTQP